MGNSTSLATVKAHQLWNTAESSELHLFLTVHYLLCCLHAHAMRVLYPWLLQVLWLCSLFWSWPHWLSRLPDCSYFCWKWQLLSSRHSPLVLSFWTIVTPLQEPLPLPWQQHLCILPTFLCRCHLLKQWCCWSQKPGRQTDWRVLDQVLNPVLYQCQDQRASNNQMTLQQKQSGLSPKLWLDPSSQWVILEWSTPCYQQVNVDHVNRSRLPIATKFPW